MKVWREIVKSLDEHPDEWKRVDSDTVAHVKGMRISTFLSILALQNCDFRRVSFFGGWMIRRALRRWEKNRAEVYFKKGIPLAQDAMR